MAFKELFGSRKVTKSAGGITGERIFLDDSWSGAFANAPNIGDPFPGIPALFVQSVEFVPFGKAVPGDDAASHAKIIARYSTLDSTQQQQTGRKLDESLEFGGEMLTRADGYWEECKAKVEKEDIGGTWYPRLVYTLDASVDSLEGAEILKILDATGKLNEVEFLGTDPETWLFEGASARSFYDENGVKKWRLTYRFIYRDTNFNKPWHGQHDGGGKYEYVVFKEEGDPEAVDQWTGRLYKLADFNDLLNLIP